MTTTHFVPADRDPRPTVSGYNPGPGFEYISCEQSDIPAKVRFDVTARNQGQIVEVAYGTFGRGEAGRGDPYKRITDQSIDPRKPERVKYFRLVALHR